MSKSLTSFVIVAAASMLALLKRSTTLRASSTWSALMNASAACRGDRNVPIKSRTRSHIRKFFFHCFLHYAVTKNEATKWAVKFVQALAGLCFLLARPKRVSVRIFCRGIAKWVKHNGRSIEALNWRRNAKCDARDVSHVEHKRAESARERQGVRWPKYSRSVLT